MAATAPDEQDSDLLLRVQDLQGRLDSEGEPATRELAEELVATVVQLYGDGLERIVGTLMEDGEAGRRLSAKLVEDDLIASLLLIHDVHPVPLHERVTAALEQVRPYMESHGGNVELLSLEDGVARISLRGSCSDCAASAVTLELAIKQALEATAPDLERLEVEGAAPAPSGPSLPLAGDSPPGGGFELPMVISETSTPSPAWFEADHLDLIPVGRIVAATVGGSELVVANVDGTLLAYANSCAGCGSRLDAGELTAGTLACPACARSFFLPRAGRSMDSERLQLEPFPLLREQGRVKVALGA
jgi:Fe-S cluster biogenesis protein NfuA/nitrite reductase/ring-hydroxylating ferredoxin subunit